MAENETKPKRKLTSFLAQEMLYDYATNELDEGHRAAVDEFLKVDNECQRILGQIQSGLEYSAHLRDVELNAQVVAQLRDAENVVSLGRKYATWSSWPETVRWSVIAVCVSSIVASSFVIVPWARWLKFNSARVTDVSGKQNAIDVAINENGAPLPEDKEPEAPPSPEPSAGVKVAETTESSGDDIADSSESGEPAPATPPPKAATPSAKPTPVAALVAKALPKPPNSVSLAPPAENQLVAKLAVGSAANSTTSVASNALKSGEEVGDHKKDKKPKGFVFRGTMTLGNLEEVGPQIAALIRDLGGQKAGEVELGWKRGTGRYYHFSIPETSEKKLLDSLQAYGPVQFSKDPHPRVMPAGQLRFILWIESTN